MEELPSRIARRDSLRAGYVLYHTHDWILEDSDGEVESGAWEFAGVEKWCEGVTWVFEGGREEDCGCYWGAWKCREVDFGEIEIERAGRLPRNKQQIWGLKKQWTVQEIARWALNQGWWSGVYWG
jgi:hypothetical protein